MKATGTANAAGPAGVRAAGALGTGVRAAEAGGATSGELLGLERARVELGLDQDEFDLALQLGEVRTVTCAPGLWKVPRREIARLAAEDGHPDALLRRVRLVGAAAAAETLGSGRDRFVRLARAGCVRPVRWYANRYRAVVWMYRAVDLEEFAAHRPELIRGRLPGRLPDGLREALEDGRDRRPRGWRERRTAQLVRDAFDAWEEAAVWAALLGPGVVADAVPDPCERAHLHRLRAALPPGRAGRATPEQVMTLTRADAPEEITSGLLALGDALGRARALRPAPGHASGAGPAPALPSAPVLLLGRSAAAPTAPAPAAAAAASAEPGDPAADFAAPTEPTERAEPTGSTAAATTAVARVRSGMRRLLPVRRGPATRRPPGTQSSPTSVRRITARPSSSEAARSTSAEMPQP